MKCVWKVKEADDKNLLSIVVWARDFFMGRIDKKSFSIILLVIE